MRKVLKPEFFKRSTVKVAHELLGKFLVRKLGKKVSALMITEVEAYDGFRDRGSHAFRGQTARTKIMFGSPGHWYVYFTYGMYYMLNIVTREEGYPAAILIRSVRSVKNGEPRPKIRREIKGPGRLTKFLRIDKKLNGAPASPKSGLWIEDRGFKVKKLKIKKGPRVGIAYAGQYWAGRHLRFWLSL